MQNNISTDLFEDDTTLSESSSNIAEIQHNLQNRLNLIQKWCVIIWLFTLTKVNVCLLRQNKN